MIEHAVCREVPRGFSAVAIYEMKWILFYFKLDRITGIDRIIFDPSGNKE